MKAVLLVVLCFGLAAAMTDMGSDGGLATYSYAKNGADWTGLCSTGQAQSPINIETAKTVCVRHGEDTARAYRIDFHYAVNVQNLSLVNTGATVRVRGDLGFVTIGGCNPCNGQEYRVKRFVFRTPSEHTIDATAAKPGNYPMELQIVHQKVGSTGKNDLVIVSIFFYVQPEGGFSNGFLDNLNWSAVPKAKGQAVALTGGVNMHKLHEALHNAEYYTYKGSLTYPTCDETVTYFIMKTPLGITQPQMDSILNVFQKNKEFGNGNGNNRITQPLNNRQVIWYRRRH